MKISKQKLQAKLFPKIKKSHWIYRLLTVVFVLSFLGVISIGGYLIYDDWSPYVDREVVFEFQEGFVEHKAQSGDCYYSSYSYTNYCDGKDVGWIDKKNVINDFFILTGAEILEATESLPRATRSDRYLTTNFDFPNNDLNRDGVVDAADVVIANKAYERLIGSPAKVELGDLFNLIVQDKQMNIETTIYWNDLGVATLWMLILLLSALVGFWLTYRVFVYIVAGK